MPPSPPLGPILTINAGSSSLRFAVYDDGTPPKRRWAGRIERIGLSGSTMTPYTGESASEPVAVSAADHLAAGAAMVDWLEGQLDSRTLIAIGHRIVHGGPHYDRPGRIDEEMMEELRRISPWDPDHLPPELALVGDMASRFAGVPQVACFDTAFHRHMPEVAKLVALPRRYREMGVQRYGFHGLSYAFVLGELRRLAGDEAAQGRVILAHLGNGASLAAVRDGVGVETTMGFTPASGVPMGTRSGDLDPGLARFIMQRDGLSPEQFDEMVHHRSGLLGVSGISPDMRDLLARRSADPRAGEAVDLFVYRVKKAVGALAAVLGGLDTLVFTGGIGEHAAPVRAGICDGMGFLGIELDAAANAADAPVISCPDGATVRIIPTDEQCRIAQAVREVLCDGEG